jgi:hypothetical protein
MLDSTVWQRILEFRHACVGNLRTVEFKPSESRESFKVDQPGVGYLGVVETQTLQIGLPSDVD